MDKTSGRIVLFSGYAKLPAGITASELYKVIGIVVLINIDTEEIVDADCTLATELSRKHLASALIGQNLKDGPDHILRLVDQIYQGNAKKAIFTAIRVIYDKYRSYVDGTPSND